MPALSANYSITNFAEFQSYVTGFLGGNLVDVELTQDDFLNAFAKAKATWFQKGNVNLNESFVSVPVTTNVSTYSLTSNSVAIDTIIKLVRPTNSFYTNNPFSIAIFNDLFGGIINQGQMDIYTFEGTLQFIDLIDMYTIADPNYIWNRRTQQLQLLKAPTANDVWFLHCYTYPPDLDLWNFLWTQEWTIAECKHILGLAYNKFSQVQGPAGEIQLPGKDLIEEAKDMKKELLDNINDYTDADEIGGYIRLG